MSEKARTIRPIVKWAGGKRQLLSELLTITPSEFNNYHEPFFGGGAYYLALTSLGKISGKAYLNDANPELINLYKVVQNCPEKISAELQKDQYANERSVYLCNRERFNEIRGSDKTFERAVLFLYLNRFGYNGLWRVNSRGEYNIPFGRHKDSHSYADEDVLKNFSKALAPAILSEGDFSHLLKNIRKGDLVYFDPPYHPISKTSFTSYTENSFTYSDQVRLAEMFYAADKRGAFLILSNSVADEIKNLYEDYSVEKVSVKRFINSNADGRYGAKEILVKNF